MKRIAIITWITYPNFGTYLQAYALQQYIKSLGYDCKILDDSPYTKTFTNWKNKIFKFRKFNLQLLIYKCRKYVSYLPPC